MITTQLYNSQRAEEELAKLEFERETIEDSEYLVAWISNTVDLSPEQEQKAREILRVPKGRFENLGRRIEVMEKYTQPTMLGGKN
jgi:hypothetical protein